MFSTSTLVKLVNSVPVHVILKYKMLSYRRETLLQGELYFSPKLHCVSEKNIPDIFSCNFIMFCTNVTEKVSNQ